MTEQDYLESDNIFGNWYICRNRKVHTPLLIGRLLFTSLLRFVFDSISDESGEALQGLGVLLPGLRPQRHLHRGFPVYFGGIANLSVGMTMGSPRNGKSITFLKA